MTIKFKQGAEKNICSQHLKVINTSYLIESVLGKNSNKNMVIEEILKI